MCSSRLSRANTTSQDPRYQAIEMSPIKRRSDGATESTRPEKKQKSSSTTKVSVLKEEEPAFPRGGASILTPLEHKQIQIQAKSDVLFEQNTGKKAAKNEFENEENDEDMPDQPSAPSAKAKRKSRSKDKKGGKDGAVEEATVRVEGLSYKVGDPRSCNIRG